MLDRRLDTTWWALRLALGIVPIVAGADKFWNALTDWRAYLSPQVEALLPVPGEVFLQAAGVVEVAVGILVLTRWTRIGAYAACAWLVAIAASLVASGRFLDVAARDAVMAVAAFALARLDTVRQPVASGAADERAPAALEQVAGT